MFSSRIPICFNMHCTLSSFFFHLPPTDQTSLPSIRIPSPHPSRVAPQTQSEALDIIFIKIKFFNQNQNQNQVSDFATPTSFGFGIWFWYCEPRGMDSVRCMTDLKRKDRASWWKYARRRFVPFVPFVRIEEIACGIFLISECITETG